MSFPRYPAYKASGVEWLGDVPQHWNIVPIKRLIQKIESGTSVNASDEAAEDGKLGVLKTSCVYTGIFNPDENKTVVEEEIDRVSCPLKAGTLIVSRMNTPDLIGAAGFVTHARDNLFLPDRLWQISFSNADPRFVYFWTLTSLYRGQVKAVCTGTSSSMKNLGQDQFNNFSFAAAPLIEQTQIGSFLDRETAKIDGLVGEQRRLIELLKEKRQAVISHAVTKGLNPHAPLKPSGIEWLGDVPEHWEVIPFKFAVDRIETGTSVNAADIPADEGKLGVLKTSCVYSGRFDPNENKTVVENELARVSCPLRSGTLIVSRMNTPDLVGAAGLVRHAPPNLFLPDRLWQVNLRLNEVFPEFAYSWTLSEIYRSQIKAVVTGTSSSMKNLGQGDFGNFIFIKPPIPEQSAIVSWLVAETAKFDGLTAEAERAIALLQERRTALISAAVTGKIDVRGLGTLGADP